MLKRDELANLQSCLNRALSHEMIFVLLARDEAARAAIREWIQARIASQKNAQDDAQVTEALTCAHVMEDQRSGIKLQLAGNERRSTKFQIGASHEPEYVIVSDGEGAEACVLASDDLQESVHRFMCVCGKRWRACDSATQDDIEQIDDAEKWSRDEAGRLFSICWPHETGKLTLYRLSGPTPASLTANTERMWTLILLNETSQTSYAELKGSQSMDIPCEFLALCEFAEEMGVKLP